MLLLLLLDELLLEREWEGPLRPFMVRLEDRPLPRELEEREPEMKRPRLSRLRFLP